MIRPLRWLWFQFLEPYGPGFCFPCKEWSYSNRLHRCLICKKRNWDLDPP